MVAVPGTVRKRSNGLWEVRVSLPRDSLTGGRQQLTRYVRGTRAEADLALARLTVEATDTGAPDPAGRHTVARLLEEWLDLISGRLAPKTVHEYRRLSRARVVPALGDRPVRAVDASEVDRFYRALQREAGLSAASVRQVHAVLSGAFGQAVKWGWIPASPITRTSPPPVRQQEIRPPAPVDVNALIAAARADDPDFGIFLVLAATTGARRGELCALRWLDIDLDAGSMVIHRALTDVGGKVSEKTTKTRVARRLRLDARTVSELRAHREAAEDRATSCGVPLSPLAFVCSHAGDGAAPLRPDKATSTFTALRNRLGQPTVRLHDLRHFMATTALAAGVPVRTVSGRLGHANAATTLGVYGHFVEASDAAAAELLRAAMDGADG